MYCSERNALSVSENANELLARFSINIDMFDWITTTTTAHKNKKINFCRSDKIEFFRQNLKTQPKNWIYRHKTITYMFNECGFREIPMNQINWKESVIIIGCSHVLGDGLAVEDTLSKQLEKIIQRPVINLGVSGSGMDIACWNSLTLHEQYPIPRAIIHVWSSLDRYAIGPYYIGSTYIPVKQKLPNKNDYQDLNWKFRSEKYILTDRALWKNKTCYLEYSWFDHTATAMDIELFNGVDLARDCIHYGIQSQKLAAEKIANDLAKHL
jgi:hypothetical protein